MNRLRELRALHGLKQTDLARELNVARTAISKYENGQLDLSSATILRLCEIFGVSADYLIGRTPLPSPDLDPQEEAMLMAWRRATPEIRAIIEAALAPYREEDTASAPTA